MTKLSYEQKKQCTLAFMRQLDIVIPGDYKITEFSAASGEFIASDEDGRQVVVQVIFNDEDSQPVQAMTPEPTEPAEQAMAPEENAFSCTDENPCWFHRKMLENAEAEAKQDEAEKALGTFYIVEIMGL